MPTLMLINPIGAKKMAKTRKHRSAAQKMATKHLVSLNRARRSSPKRSSTAVAKRRTNPIGLSRVKHARRSTRKVAHRRHNPIGGLMRAGASGVMGMSMQALTGAGGAILVNTVLNYVPMLPVALKSGNGKYLARAGMAIAVGVFGPKMLPEKVATDMAVGALTVALHDLLLGITATAMPTLKLGDVGDFDTGVSEYLEPAMAGVSGYDVYDTNGSSVGEYIN